MLEVWCRRGTLVLVGVAVALSACGGGGGSGPAPVLTLSSGVSNAQTVEGSAPISLTLGGRLPPAAR